MRHCHYGDLQGSFEGRGWELFKRGWKLWLAALSPFLLAVVLGIVTAGQKAPVAAGLSVLATLIWMISLPFIFGAFRAIEWRWWISGIRFGGVSFESDLSAHDLYGLYWKVIAWFLVIMLLFGAYITACIGLLAGFSDPTRLAALMRGSIGLTAATVVGYLGFILALNVVLRVYLVRDIWARVAASTSVHRLDAVANVTAKGELASALGEGLSGSLDVVGF
jgi:uncharacterized membrane protein YjgN (DUF898 family)